MTTGTLKVFDRHVGHGIVQADDGTEFFISSATLVNAGLANIREGARIEFGIDPRGGGAGITGSAVNIQLLPDKP
jgi:cold shock CspA family protein